MPPVIIAIVWSHIKLQLLFPPSSSSLFVKGIVDPLSRHPFQHLSEITVDIFYTGSRRIAEFVSVRLKYLVLDGSTVCVEIVEDLVDYFGGGGGGCWWVEGADFVIIVVALETSVSL